MTKLYLSLKNLVTRDEEGQGLVEYALIIALVSVLLVLALTGLKDHISTTFTSIGTSLK